MANYKEIVTKAVIAKGKKLFISNNSVSTSNTPSTILGCWVINHNFSGEKIGESIHITGSYDINIWYSYDNDSKTEVVKHTDSYDEVVKMRSREDTDSEEIIVRSLKQPNCVKVDIKDNSIDYVIEKELGIELVGDIKVKIEANQDEDPWDEIVEDTKIDEKLEENIDETINENYVDENTI